MTTRKTLVIALVSVLLLVVPAVTNVYVVGLMTRVLAYAIIAMSLDLLIGYAGLISFGHAAFVGIGAYATGLLVLGGVTNAFVGLVAAFLAGGVAALLIGSLAVRVKGIYFIMLTFAFSQMVFYLAVGQPRLGADDGMPLPARMQYASFLSLQHPPTLFYTALVLLVGTFMVLRRVVRSPSGLALQGCRQDEVRLATLGFPIYWHRLSAFTAAGAIAGLGGFVLINLDAYLGPSLLDWRISGIITMIVVIGGVGTLVGSMMGAVVYLIVEEFTSRYTDHWPILFGVLLVAVALGWKNGIYGFMKTAIDRRVHWVGARQQTHI